jgi:hypothetical protein
MAGKMSKRRPKMATSGLAVLDKRCNQCLFSSARIVPEARARNLIEKCVRDGTYFVCHKASNHNLEAVCRGFYDVHDTRILQIAKRLNVVRFVSEEDLAK